MARTLRSRSDARKNRALSPAFLARRWKPGESGNPSGQTAEYGDVVKLARSNSVRAIQRLSELMESDDERVSAVAANAILDRAFGRPQQLRPEAHDSLVERLSRMTPEERAQDAREVLQRVRQRLSEYHKQSQAEEDGPVIEGQAEAVPRGTGGIGRR